MTNLPKIRGFNKSSEAGVDVFAPSIFLDGCNLRCPYCMNSKLVKKEISNEIDIGTIKDYVAVNKEEWMVISGGEPTCTNIESLIMLLEEIKSWGCKISMSTNGTNPAIIEKIIHLLNYVSMDIKSARNENYYENALVDITETRMILEEERSKRENFNYEIRTTLYPPFINKEDIEQIGNRYDTWVLQQFRHDKSMLDPKCFDIKPYNNEEIEELVKIAKRFCSNVHLKYV
jgi:pyruvate formate lyase activating enzyme